MDKILEKIESDKEILSTMPRNTKKNTVKYMEQVDELKTEYENCKTEIFEEMKKRYDGITNIEEDKEIDNLDTQTQDIEKILSTIDNLKTSYEKMELDKKIYKLGKFYKENLDSVNQEIFSCIQKFKEVGVEIQPKDFDYSAYTEEYMKVFFEEAKKQDINSDIIKNKFEEIYWKCPDIIIYIELNIRNTFLRNQNTIDKYFNKKREDLLKTVNLNPDQIENKYVTLKKELMIKQNTDKATIVHNFLNNVLNVKDYDESKINDDYSKMLSKVALNNIDKTEINENAAKFVNSLNEFKDYIKFKFVLEDLKKKYSEREQHKTEYNTLRKEISAQEKKLKALNKKMNSKGGLFGKKKEKVEKQNVEYGKILDDLKEKYKQLDTAEVYLKLTENLNDNSTIYDALKFALAFNNYLTECIAYTNKDMNMEDIENFITELKNFVNNPYNNIIKNITIMEEKDIPIIISDRYKLLNFNISKEDITVDNADNLINTLKHLTTKYNMDVLNVKVEDMEFICEFKKLLSKL